MGNVTIERYYRKYMKIIKFRGESWIARVTPYGYRRTADRDIEAHTCGTRDGACGRVGQDEVFNKSIHIDLLRELEADI
jgi:hypothetical protein